ncbi:MAG: substrate-binding domain-containing protein [Thermomicrobiales bacterium]
MKERAESTEPGRRSGWQRVLGWMPIIVIVLGVLAHCTTGDSSSQPTFHLLTGSENRELDPIIQRFAKQEDVTIETSYQGSVDTMITIQQGAKDYDAIWPASSLWVTLGNTGNVVTKSQSIMRTPVIFAVKRPVAKKLGWVGRNVTVEEILAAVEAGQLHYMMTSATQSNSGAMAYLGYLYAFADQPPVLTSAMLHDPTVLDKTKRILNAVNRSAGASGYLKDLFLQHYDEYDGMVNNESAVISANQQLVIEGKEPLYAIYPKDGLAIADWPLGFVDHGEADKAEFFAKFQAYLLSEDVQQELLGKGRRTGLGPNPVGADPNVFNPDWGIDVNRVIQPITLPPADVINEALTLYQTTLRKPSLTIYCLDFSSSMKGKGEDQLKAAMEILLDPDQSSRYLLQPSPGDITVVIPFTSEVLDTWRANGSDLTTLLELVTTQEIGGGTNIYAPVIAGLDAMNGINLDDYSPAIILMTDGQSNSGSFNDLQARLGASPDAVPVYAVLFGDASEKQLKVITGATSGDMFDGRKDLIGAMRKAKGYN